MKTLQESKIHFAIENSQFIPNKRKNENGREVVYIKYAYLVQGNTLEEHLKNKVELLKEDIKNREIHIQPFDTKAKHQFLVSSWRNMVQVEEISKNYPFLVTDEKRVVHMLGAMLQEKRPITVKKVVA